MLSMYRFFFAFTLLFSVSCTQVTKNEQSNILDTPNLADAKVTTPQQQTKKAVDPIISIRERVTHINTTSLEKKHFELMCDEQTKVDFFYEKNEKVKITVDFGTVGDVYAREDYYYDKNKLIFVYEFVEGGLACEGCIKKNEYRYYIVADKVFKYLKDKDVEKCRKCEFVSSSRQYRLLTANTEHEIKAIVCKL
jgi:hypothetical protein